jgi:hypothetical protein
MSQWKGTRHVMHAVPKQHILLVLDPKESMNPQSQSYCEATKEAKQNGRRNYYSEFIRSLFGGGGGGGSYQIMRTSEQNQIT